MAASAQETPSEDYQCRGRTSHPGRALIGEAIRAKLYVNHGPKLSNKTQFQRLNLWLGQVAPWWPLGSSSGRQSGSFISKWWRSCCVNELLKATSSLAIDRSPREAAAETRARVYKSAELGRAAAPSAHSTDSPGAMLRGALLLLVLCALAAAFPTLPPESTVETQDLTSFPSADVESTTDLLVLTTDQDQTTPSEPITEFSADMVTATPTSVEYFGERPVY